MKIAYLVNQYPTISHSFIRREILALEALGISIARFSIRSCADKVVDEADHKEVGKTQVVLSVGVTRLLFHSLRAAFTQPICWLQALLFTLKIGWHSDRGLLIHLAYLAEACVLCHWLARQEITHVHAHFGTNSTTVAMLCHFLGGPPYSFTVHGPEEFDKVLGIALPEKIKRAAFVVAISSFGCSQLYRWCDYREWSKIQLVRCGVDDAFFSVPWQPMSDEPRFVCIGRLSEQKGQLLLVKAVSQLVTEGFTLKVVLVGDGTLREPIESAIAKLGLENVIELTGWATEAEVQQQLLAARAMVLPSFAEGLPVVIMESLASFRPVISTYVAGIPELVEPGVSGWLVPAGSVEDLVAAMRSVLQMSTVELERMGKMGAEQVARQHNIKHEAEKLIRLFGSSSVQN